jgi:hypothetical protein
LLRFDFSVEFKLGSSNIMVDALPRRDVEASTELATLSAPSFHLFDTLQHENEDTLELRNLREKLRRATVATSGAWLMASSQ